MVQVTTTTHGRETLNRCWQSRDLFLAERIAQLSAKERVAIVKALPALERLLDPD
jgi:hypothetical protein